MNNIFTANDGKKLKRVSKWLKIKSKYVTPRHSLYDYSYEGELTYFLYKGKEYALSQFLRLSYPIIFENEEEKTTFISGYDCTNYYNPLLIELSDGCEEVRLFETYED